MLIIGNIRTLILLRDGMRNTEDKQLVIRILDGLSREGLVPAIPAFPVDRAGDG